MSMNLRRIAALLRLTCPPKLELAALGGMRFYSSAVNATCLVKRLEAEGLPTNHAEVITSVVSEILNDRLQNAAHAMQKRSESLQDSKLSSFKLEVQSSRWRRLSSLQHEIEKLKVDTEKLDNELSAYIMEKLAKQELEIMEATAKLDRDINALRAQIDATNFDIVKYCFGTISSIIAVCVVLSWLKM